MENECPLCLLQEEIVDNLFIKIKIYVLLACCLWLLAHCKLVVAYFARCLLLVLIAYGLWLMGCFLWDVGREPLLVACAFDLRLVDLMPCVCCHSLVVYTYTYCPWLMGHYPFARGAWDVARCPCLCA